MGVSAELTSGISTNDLLLRWDPTQQQKKTFIGKNELVEQEIGIDAYIPGNVFLSSGHWPGPRHPRVLIEDPPGTYVSADGRKYRAATYVDVMLDSTLGLVSLRNAVKGRVLVYYKKNGSSVGDTAIGKVSK